MDNHGRLGGIISATQARDPTAHFFEGGTHLQGDTFQGNPPLSPKRGSILGLLPEHRGPHRPKTMLHRRLVLSKETLCP